MSKYFSQATCAAIAGTLIFNTPIYAADLGQQIDLKNIKVTGRDVAEVFALQCADDTYKAFAEWAHQNNYLTKTIAVKDHSASRRGNSLTFSSGVEINALAADKIEIKDHGKKYSGTDLCDLFLKTNTGAKNSAANDSFSLFGRAWADDIVKENLSNYVGTVSKPLLYGTIIGWAAAAVTAPVLLPIGLAVGAVVGGLNYYTKRQENNAKKTFESILNAPFSVTCDKISSMTIQGSGHKIIVDKTSLKGYKVNVLKLKGGDLKRDQLSVFDDDTYGAKSREILFKWASTCNNPEDALRLEEEIAARQKSTKTRLEMLSRTKAVDAVAGKATK